MNTYSLGIDLGGTQIKTVALDSAGTILFQDVSPTHNPLDPKDDWSNQVLLAVEKVEQSLGYTPSFIGVSSPGMAAADNSHIVSLPGRLLGLENLNWTQFLKRDFFVPVLNDAHAALMGELRLGAASTYDNVIFLTLGTGVGGGFTINGKLQSGSLGRAGHFGHTALNTTMPKDIKNSPGSIELMIGECTVKERTQGKFNSTKELVEAYLKGDDFASEIWLKSVYNLACAIASFINILDPQVVILGGGISKAGDALMSPLAKYMDEVEWRPQNHQVPIKLAQLGNTAGAIGAAFFAMHYDQVFV